MTQHSRAKITVEDCLAYAEACEVWAGGAPSAATRARLLEMGRRWRDLGRHLQGSEAAAQARSGKQAKAGRGQSAAKLKPAAPRSGGRRPH
jgi:hypothetical protein